MLLLVLLLLSGMPHRTLTPGVIRPLSRQIVCETRWGKDTRHVTQAMKKQVFASYGIQWSQRSLYEVDHLIPRSLAGADDVRNLWPEAWAGATGARVKDHLEVVLGRKVCRGELSLREAQEAIRSDWRAAFRKYVP